MSLKDKYAYPTHAAGVNNLGMTYREWLVGMIASGMVSNDYYSGDENSIAEWAIQQADAIIAALESKKECDQ